LAERCEFEAILELLSQRHTLSILRLLAAKHPRGFNEIRGALGVNPKTLTDRLKGLMDEGIVSREALNQIPRKVNYRLTQKGMELVEVFKTISAWHEKYPSRGSEAQMSSKREE
jgi:DNA-binding HxlR family transcriptional regulator